MNSLENAEKIISNNVLALRNLMGTDHNAFMMQLCAYKDMTGSFDNWRSDEDELQRVLADTTMTADERKEAEASFQSPGKMISADSLMPISTKRRRLSMLQKWHRLNSPRHCRPITPQPTLSESSLPNIPAVS